MIDIAKYPLCAKRLEFQRANLNDPAFNAYWAAVCIAEDFSDDKLANVGGMNFNNRSEANGYMLLEKLESLIKSSARAEAKSNKGGLSAAEVSVRAFLGANGIKVSKLNGLVDFWTAAITMWPGHVSPVQSDMETLHFQINKIQKKQRSKMARKNLAGLPATWRAR